MQQETAAADVTDSERLVRIETLLIAMTSKGDDHEIRIRRLEKVLYAGIGFAAAYLFSVVHPTIHDNRALKRVGQRPVLGAVSLMPSLEVLRRRRRSVH